MERTIYSNREIRVNIRIGKEGTRIHTHYYDDKQVNGAEKEASSGRL